MDLHHFDALAQALAPSRRSTLATLVATATSFSGGAKARGKKKGPDCGKHAKQRCSLDAEDCRDVMMAYCQASTADCRTYAACCDTCSADGMLTCLLALALQETKALAQVALGENGARDAS